MIISIYDFIIFIDPLIIQIIRFKEQVLTNLTSIFDEKDKTKFQKG